MGSQKLGEERIFFIPDLNRFNEYCLRIYNSPDTVEAWDVNVTANWFLSMCKRLLRVYFLECHLHYYRLAGANLKHFSEQLYVPQRLRDVFRVIARPMLFGNRRYIPFLPAEPVKDAMYPFGCGITVRSLDLWNRIMRKYSTLRLLQPESLRTSPLLFRRGDEIMAVEDTRISEIQQFAVTQHLIDDYCQVDMSRQMNATRTDAAEEDPPRSYSIVDNTDLSDGIRNFNYVDYCRKFIPAYSPKTFHEFTQEILNTQGEIKQEEDSDRLEIQISADTTIDLRPFVDVYLCRSFGQVGFVVLADATIPLFDTGDTEHLLRADARLSSTPPDTKVVSASKKKGKG